MALVGTFAFEFEFSPPLLAEKTFHGTDTTYSWLIGAIGAGAVAGGLPDHRQRYCPACLRP